MSGQLTKNCLVIKAKFSALKMYIPLWTSNEYFINKICLCVKMNGRLLYAPLSTEFASATYLVDPIVKHNGVNYHLLGSPITESYYAYDTFLITYDGSNGHIKIELYSTSDQRSKASMNYKIHFVFYMNDSVLSTEDKTTEELAAENSPIEITWNTNARTVAVPIPDKVIVTCDGTDFSGTYDLSTNAAKYQYIKIPLLENS